jgi:hypothetical protein
MNLFANWNIDTYLSLISLLVLVAGGIVALMQWKAEIKTRRSEFIYQIINHLRFDEQTVQTMYTIDYGVIQYDENFHHGGSHLEHSVDKLLSCLDYICYLGSTRNISKKEFKIFRYEISRTCACQPIQSYLWNLYHFSKRNKTECSFQNLIDSGITDDIFPDNFTKNDQNLYKKCLNF